MKPAISPWLLAALAAMVIVAIGGKSYSYDNVELKQVKATGTVIRVKLEGGFWGIKASDGEKYDPLDSLPKEFRKNGLKIRFEATLDKEAVSTHMWGTIIKIEKVKKAE
jgi:hypothetical protein